MNTLLGTRNARWLAWLVLGLYVALMGAGLALIITTRSPAFGVALALELTESAVLSVWAVVGALIISRHPVHPVGWLWCALPILVALDNIAWGYAYYGSIIHPGSLPGVEIAIVYLYTLLGRQTLGPLGMTLLFLVFPTGRLPSRGWRSLAWIAVGTAAIIIPVTALAPDPIGYFPFPEDLFAWAGAARTILEPLRAIAITALSLCLLAAAVSLLVRLGRARGEERQQIKWFVYAAFLIPFGFLLTTLGGFGQVSGMNGIFLSGGYIMILGITSVSIASAIAIFRYRLWEIDLIIRRTLIFGLLTGILILVYFSSVVFIRQLIQTLTGQQSHLAIVISTLAIAALFSPLRRRIQDLIDRRFYRRKYDAERIVAAFGADLREEVNLEQMTKSLVAVVEETIQPESVLIWLKSDERRLR